MALRAKELELLAAELTRELGGGVIQKVHAPTTSRVYLEVRVPGRSVTVLLCTEPGVARLSAVETRPPNPSTPPTWQSVLRRELTGAKLHDVEALPERRTLLLHLTREQTIRRTLALEPATAPSLVLATEASRILCVSNPARAGLRVGGEWTLPPEQPQREAPSRLAGDHTFLRLTHACETLFSTQEQRAWDDARKAPVVAQLKKLERTMAKVRAEADRSERALALRREGELLTQNLWRLKRGEPAVTVTQYLEDGTEQPVTIPLDPRRTPAQEVEWRFHQYRRLLRGSELAGARLQRLEAELATLKAQLSELEAHPAPPPAPGERARARAEANAPLPPYREYRGHGAQRIWVGRGAAHNDSLTFHVARPFHVWFHARGVPGAHVVVPLEKNTQLAPEVLLDAAHLALHHSDGKGEPRGEVSYTQVKFVHRGAAPGAVTYTREKTINLRVEPGRLERLLASERDLRG